MANKPLSLHKILKTCDHLEQRAWGASKYADEIGLPIPKRVGKQYFWLLDTIRKLVARVRELEAKVAAK